MAVTYYIKLFRTGADTQNNILMSLLLLVAETKKIKAGENYAQTITVMSENI